MSSWAIASCIMSKTVRFSLSSCYEVVVVVRESEGGERWEIVVVRNGEDC